MCWRKGPRNDWFADESIVLLAWVSVLSAALFFWRAFTARQPIVDLKAFGDRNFALGSLFSFVLGIGLYGLTFIYPLYLAQIRGYDALMIGETHVRLGAGDVPDRAARRPADRQGRSAHPCCSSAFCSSRSAPGG